MEESHKQNTVRSQSETLHTSDMHQGLEKGTRRKEISFDQNSKLFGAVKTQCEGVEKGVLRQSGRRLKMTDEFQGRKM